MQDLEFIYIAIYFAVAFFGVGYLVLHLLPEEWFKAEQNAKQLELGIGEAIKTKRRK